MAEITLNVPLAEFDRMRNRIAELERENTRLEAAAAPKLVDETALVLEAFLAALPMVSFACANCRPTEFPDYPEESLRMVAQALLEEPIKSRVCSDLYRGYTVIADDAKFWNAERAKGTHVETFRDMVAARAVTPARVREAFGHRGVQLVDASQAAPDLPGLPAFPATDVPLPATLSSPVDGTGVPEVIPEVSDGHA